MTEPLHPDTPDGSTPDETFTWTGDATDAGHHADAGQAGGSGAGASGPTGASSAGATATAILESIRDAVDDLAERATPTMREFSARAAELAAIAADRAAPIAKRAGDVTSDASGKLASKSRIWAADLRASMAPSDAAAPSAGASDASGPTAPEAASAPATQAADDDVHPSDGATPA
jgi:hypothetical protein